jgi:AcrR family transcriptional regulator
VQKTTKCRIRAVTGLRERKKERTRSGISAAAIALFLERGYDQVSVAEVAEAAEVSKRTLFAYFPTKDDLVLHRFADHEDESARVVRARKVGVSPLAALHGHLRAALERRDPVSGLCDDPRVVRFYRLVVETPALSAAIVRYHARAEDALAAALVDTAPSPSALTARLAAGQILFTLRALAQANLARIIDGASADAVAPSALAEADDAFALLGGGLAPYR